MNPARPIDVDLSGFNAALREYIRRREGTDLAETLRQVIREELRAVG